MHTYIYRLHHPIVCNFIQRRQIDLFMSGLEDSFVSNSPVTNSDMDYFQAQTILDLTNNKQKQLRRQRTQRLLPQLLLKRTHVHVCQLLNCHCSIEKPLPLATVDINKRKLNSDDHQVPTNNKKSKGLMETNILEFLRELNAVKIPIRY